MWTRAWEARVALHWVDGPRYITVALASNENVEPASPTARALWLRAYNRGPLMRNWSARLDMRVVDAAGAGAGAGAVVSIDVCASVAFSYADAALGPTAPWVVVDLELERLVCSMDEAARYASVRVEDARLHGWPFRSLSRNPATRPVDVLVAPTEAWDAAALAENASIPVDFVLGRFAHIEGVFEALSRNPNLEWRHVRDHAGAPWNALAITANPVLTTPESVRSAAFPFVVRALGLNPLFMRCPTHGYVCEHVAPRDESDESDERAPCGMPTVAEARARKTDVNWELFLRHTDAPTEAIRAAVASNVHGDTIVRGATSNKHLRLCHAAWLGSLIARRSWLGGAFVMNPMRACRAEFERGERVASLFVGVVARAHGWPWHVTERVRRETTRLAVLGRDRDAFEREGREGGDEPGR